MKKLTKEIVSASTSQEVDRILAPLEMLIEDKVLDEDAKFHLKMYVNFELSAKLKRTLYAARARSL